MQILVKWKLFSGKSIFRSCQTHGFYGKWFPEMIFSRQFKHSLRWISDFLTGSLQKMDFWLGLQMFQLNLNRLFSLLLIFFFFLSVLKYTYTFKKVKEKKSKIFENCT